MSRTRTIAAWSLFVVSAAAFMVGATASEAVRSVLPGLVTTVAAQDPPTPPPTQEPPAGGGRQGGGAAQAPRPYAQVITNAARTDEGIFKVHRVGDTVYFEIPKAELNKDFVWKVGIKKTTLGAGFGGQDVNSRVVRWSQRGDRVLLLGVDYSTYADPSLPVAQAVEDANYPSIIRAIPVATYAPSGDPVIDVTPFFVTDSVPEFSVRAAVGGQGLDATRTFLERVVSLPENVNAEATLTFTGAAAGGGRGGGGGAGGARGMRGPSGTIVVAHSMVKLPAQPMMPRYFDERVGYVAQALTDYGTEEHRSVNKRLIQRFRLQKKDPNAAVSDVVKPIVFYIDNATPKAMVPYVRRGVEEWQSAFEAAGFRNAIVAREEPTNDPEFTADDARNSVIRWVPSNEETSSTVVDPRSGEILSANVEVYPNVGTFGPYSYFVQAGAVDPRAQQIPLPQDLQGELIRYFVAHQIGHALGLQHNRKAASAYTIEQLRDPKFVKTMGFTPTIMDESRYHYVAQPEDKIDPADLIPRVGPYDKFAIKWGYAPTGSVKTPDDERKTLDQWAREQDKNAYLRWTTEGSVNADPGDSPEAVGSNNAVMATTLGVRNLMKVSDMLLKATSSRVGDPWEDLETAYGRLVTQWSTEMSHVVRVVGGLETQQLHIGQGDGMRVRTVPRAKQVEAMQYLIANAFQTPSFLIKPDILRRIEVSGVVARIRTAQTAILTALLQPQRLDRMTEQFTIDGAQAYPPLQMLMDLRNGIWSELAKPGTAITLYRRNVQRAYLDTMDQRLNGTPASSAEIRAMVKGELRALDGQLRTAGAAPGLDEATRRHLTDARDEIAAILDPRVPRSAPADAGAAGGRGRGGIR
jgi:hypothetical protein